MRCHPNTQPDNDQREFEQYYEFGTCLKILDCTQAAGSHVKCLKHRHLLAVPFNPLPSGIFGGAQPMTCGLFGPTEMPTLSVLKTILMM